MCDITSASDDLPLFDLPGAQQLHHMGDVARGQMRKDRHARDHAPGDDEVAPMDDVRECISDDADRKCDHDNASNYDDRGHHLSGRGCRNDIAISNRAECDERPPHSVWYGPELVGLDRPLDCMHGTRRYQRGANQDYEAADQGSPLAPEYIEQGVHPGRISAEFHYAQHPEHDQDTKICRFQHRAPKGTNC